MAKMVVLAFCIFVLAPGTIVDARDLWEHSTQSLSLGEISAELDSHACKMYVLTPKRVNFSWCQVSCRVEIEE
ncbi:unnamed protein product [Trifolium pratense]|uniref:Uncharacterized protein n=1 Tax=Trifolium pratense TaxID=57577 RepID=A0ACB0LM26_TRIPR|nr:unnamed protein product [Trifolium pratense]